MNRPLTSQQQIVYDFIREKILSRGYGPTVREIGEHMNIKSPNGVMCHLRALEKKQMIVRKANKSRAIELTEDLSRSSDIKLSVTAVIQQGRCIKAENGAAGQSFDINELLDGEGRIAFEVQDDSLLDAAICNGDTLVVQQQNSARSGQLAVVNWQDRSATGESVKVALLRYFFEDEDQVRLQPVNRSIPATTVDQVEVVGVVVGMVRQFSR